MIKYFIVVFYLLCWTGANAQYWFGPKVGGHRTDFVYQESTYKSDSFDVSTDYGLQGGVMMIYQASEKYAVMAELIYERINRKVTEKEGSDIEVYSKSVYNYLSIPFSLRWDFGREPTYYYISGGPKLSYWLGGTGEIYLDELNESRTLDGPLPYKFEFSQRKGDIPNHRAVPQANRFQYGLQVGAGVYFDVATGGRVLVDLRHSFGHSNMGFNGNPNFSFDTYQENFRYRNYTLSLSVAYLFEYDVQLQRKGMSTIKESNKPKKK
ncbi:outer membrane beta-barrel protein [Marinoscillum luteum]|uniref:Outer membrane beta-barrel protein n=1 Tax=Marinoscillum luteum TaxID=861051 RepID=A0ABW7N4E4_9BACT